MGVKEASATYRVLGEVALAGEGVPMGYKITDVGVIPEDWDPVPLGALARGIFRGASPRPIDDPVWFDEASSVGWVRISDVTQSSRYLFDTTQRLSPRGVEKSRYLPSGALIMSICATVGRPIETRMEVCIHDGFVVFDRPAVDQDFLYHVLSDLEPRWGSKGQTGSQMNLNTGLIKGTGVLVPRRKGEQKVIAEALSDADALIESLQQLIAKKRALKQGAMQVLLTGQKRLPGYDEEWKPSPISAQLDYERPDRYLVSSTEYVAIGSVPVLTANKSFILGYSDDVFGACEILPVIVFDDFTTDSKFADFPFKVKSSAIKLLRAGHSRVSLRYVYERMQLVRFPLGDHRRYYISDYQNLVLRWPDLEEQLAIVNVLGDMDAEIDALEARLAKARALKAGMMQALLTGRIRLPLDEAA